MTDILFFSAGYDWRPSLFRQCRLRSGRRRGLRFPGWWNSDFPEECIRHLSHLYRVVSPFQIRKIRVWQIQVCIFCEYEYTYFFKEILTYLLQGKAQLKIMFPCDRICWNGKIKTGYSNKRIIFCLHLCTLFKRTGQGDVCTLFTNAFAIVHK